MILDDKLLDEVTARAKTSERLRMNFNLHDSLDAKAQRLLNALEPGTVLPVAVCIAIFTHVGVVTDSWRYSTLYTRVHAKFM